jgi:hypothetical protein
MAGLYFAARSDTICDRQAPHPHEVKLMNQSTDNGTLPETLIFLHIPKTGGATLRDIVRRRYRHASICEYHHRRNAEAFLALSEQQKAAYKVIQGHMPFGLHRQLPQSAAYLTMLREPISRVLSTYYFMLDRPHHPDHALAQQLSLADFVQCGEIRLMDNGQTRLIAGEHPEYGACTPALLEQAKTNLDNHFLWVGVTSHFDEGLLLLSDLLGWRWPYYVRRNVGYSHPRKHELPREVLSVVEKFNELDMALFEYVRAHFDAVLEAQDENYQLRLKRFQTINNLYGKPFNLARTVIRQVRKTIR